MHALQNNLVSFSIYQKLQDLKGKIQFMRFIKKPTDTEIIFEMARSFQKATPPEVIREVMRPLLEGTNLLQDYENRVWYTHPRMQELAQYPVGSFGRHVAEFFKANNLDEDLFPKANFKSTQEYVTSRVYQSHDFWHVLTGYDINLEDELALQAFSVGQYNQPLSLAIIAGGIIHMLQKQPERASDIMQAITQGYERGKKAKILINENIFAHLDRPLDEVRQLYNIEPRRSERSI